MDTDQKVEILQAAKEQVAESWYQGSWSQGAACIATAIVVGCLKRSKVFRESGQLMEAYIEANRLPRVGTMQIHSITAWNDAPERTLAQVLDGFDATIQYVKSQ